MDTANLKEILKCEMKLYARDGANAVSYLTVSDDECIYTVIDIGEFAGTRLVGATLIARIVNDIIHIELDQNSKPLVDALIAKGVPRNQIVLAYEQESFNNLAIGQ